MCIFGVINYIFYVQYHRHFLNNQLFAFSLYFAFDDTIVSSMLVFVLNLFIVPFLDITIQFIPPHNDILHNFVELIIATIVQNILIMINMLDKYSKKTIINAKYHTTTVECGRAELASGKIHVVNVESQ